MLQKLKELDVLAERLDIQTHVGENPNPPDTDGNGKEGSSHVKKWSNDCNRIDERRIYRSDSDLLHGCSEKIR